ncbi:hypothetical protein WA026_007110 [Henosepilachna vigintioctopunctata]|uniref:Uncharacterized protein n=1 Tax=Henosepilachna vigintioctopunctata TaxID=420089 RepID=A0AAW1V383_9CUCU
MKTAVSSCLIFQNYSVNAQLSCVMCFHEFDHKRLCELRRLFINNFSTFKVKNYQHTIQVDPFDGELSQTLYKLESVKYSFGTTSRNEPRSITEPEAGWSHLNDRSAVESLMLTIFLLVVVDLKISFNHSRKLLSPPV